MIFQTAFLASLLASYAALITETTTTTKVAKLVTPKDFKKNFKTTSLAAHLETSGIKVKPSTINLETTTFDDAQGHMRGLKMKDNFLTVTSFLDADCATPELQNGFLVNYCFNQVGEESGVKMSSLVKVNKKENLAVEIDYKGFDCKVPVFPFPNRIFNTVRESPPRSPMFWKILPLDNV
jgi:hypothetical protein